MKTDYSELEGKEIEYHHSSGKMKGIVTGCDYDVGIVVQEKDNLDKYLICLHGPSSPVSNWALKNPELHHVLFQNTVKQLKKGRYSTNNTNRLMRKHHAEESQGQNPRAENCPFSQ